ncbi:MAG: SOS response-associated peptidase [Polyangiaceae bacterium]|jgi:putative SOS response-associated peptidase YedK
MCGRAVLVNPSAIREWFDLEAIPAMPPRFNIAPSQLIAVIRTPRRLELLRWGLARPGRPPQINMRVESVARTANRQRRCLVAVDGFYEWRKGATATTRQAFLIRDAEGRPFALGGVFGPSMTGDGEDGALVDSVAILTCPPRPPVDAIHDRMPLIIPRDACARWLKPDADVTDLLIPSERHLVAIPVSPYVNSPTHDDPKCIEPAEPVQGSLF